MMADPTGKLQRERGARDEHLAQQGRSTCRRCAVCGCGQRARKLTFDSRLQRDFCERHLVK